MINNLTCTSLTTAEECSREGLLVLICSFKQSLVLLLCLCHCLESILCQGCCAPGLPAQLVAVEALSSACNWSTPLTSLAFQGDLLGNALILPLVQTCHFAILRSTFSVRKLLS